MTSPQSNERNIGEKKNTDVQSITQVFHLEKIQNQISASKCLLTYWNLVSADVQRDFSIRENN